MKKNDAYYRAFTAYKKETEQQNECLRLRKSVAENNTDKDVLETEHAKVTINEDWIEEIEKGLVFVEKALKEERQFIRTNGEVIPIEKVKNVSKNSVEHLAKHSELITREPEEGEVIPDKLYTVEKLSDYAVYENRFLYMMLCYLRDFIELRYLRILKAVNTYKGNAKISKRVKTSNGTLAIDLSVNEEIENDPYLAANNDVKDIIGRIDLIFKTVILFLSYPLMQEVAKTPMIKPPITKTNVLKMNHNFKGALALYEYVAAYEGDGFEIEPYTKRTVGFKGVAANDFAEAVRAFSFLVYEHGLGIRDYLQKGYDEEELRRQEEENVRLEEKKLALRKRVRESGIGLEDYILVLEKQNAEFGKNAEELKIAERQLEANDKQINLLRGELKGKDDEIAREKEKREEELAAQKQSYESMIENLNASHRKFVEDVQKERAAEKQAAEAVLNNAKKRVEEANEQGKIQQKIAEDQKVTIAALKDERTLMRAKINALRAKCNDFDGSENFETEENFNEIEMQYKAFKAFFRETWSKTKKSIRDKEKKFAKELKASKNKKEISDEQTDTDKQP